MSEQKNSKIEDRLQAYGQVLNQRINEPSPSARAQISKAPRRRYVLAAAAAVISVLGGGILFSSGGRSEVIFAGPTTTTTTTTSTTETSGSTTAPPAPSGIEPAPDPATFPGVDACANWFGEMADQAIGFELSATFDPRTETDEVIVLPLPAMNSSVQVILTGTGGYYSCQTSRADGRVEELTAGPGGVSPQLGADEIQSIIQSWASDTASGNSGPGSLQTIGRIGADVTAVWVTLSDGTALPGLVTDDAWFVIDGLIPQDVALFDEQYYWLLADGTVMSADADAMKQKHPTEQCAATPGCINERLLQLQSEAVAQDLDAQALALADGQISAEEQRASNRAYVDCLIGAGIDADISSDGSSTSVDLSQRTTDNQEHLTRCSRQHNDLVAELASLRNAEARLAND